MESLIVPLITFLTAILAGFVGSLVGGGALIIIPVIAFLGVPLPVAIASHKLGSIGLTAGALPEYWRKKKVLWHYVIPFSVTAMGGAYVGANFVLALDEMVMARIVGLIMLLMLPLILWKKEMGVKRRYTSGLMKAIGLILTFPLAVLSGFFGGGKPLSIYTLCGFFGFTMLEANATSMVPLLLLSLSASVVFLFGGVLDFTLTVVIFFGMFLGAYAGARMAIAKGDAWLKLVLTLMVGFSAVRFLFF